MWRRCLAHATLIGVWVIERLESRGRYLAASVPTHPNADKRGRVALHRVLVENHLGRLITRDEVVHHRNGDSRDNRMVNLEVKTRSAHTADHNVDAGLSVVLQMCALCGCEIIREKRQCRGVLAFCSRSHSTTYYQRKLARPMPLHGTCSRYWKGCRCAMCRTAQATRVREWRHRQKLGVRQR
jgi:hypothetical protein